MTKPKQTPRSHRLYEHGACVGQLEAENNRLRAANAELLAVLEKLIASSGHMSPFGGEASVKSIRKAGKYMEAYDQAHAVIAKARG